jgi:hypothetical protein
MAFTITETETTTLADVLHFKWTSEFSFKDEDIRGPIFPLFSWVPF